ncbi:hypothetical protein Tco_1430229 [Tanacetum coccineum]
MVSMGGGCGGGVDGVDGWWLRWCCRWCRSQELTIEDVATLCERHPEKHTLDSAAILHELYNEMGKLRMGCCGKLMMRVGPLILSLDGKLLVYPEWKILQTLTNVKINMYVVDVARSSLDFSNTNQWGKKEAGSSPPSSGKWAAVEN